MAFGERVGGSEEMVKLGKGNYSLAKGIFERCKKNKDPLQKKILQNIRNKSLG